MITFNLTCAWRTGFFWRFCSDSKHYKKHHQELEVHVTADNIQMSGAQMFSDTTCFSSTGPSMHHLFNPAEDFHALPSCLMHAKVTTTPKGTVCEPLLSDNSAAVEVFPNKCLRSKEKYPWPRNYPKIP